MKVKSFHKLIEILEVIKLEEKFEDGIKIISENLEQFKGDEQIAELYCYLGIFNWGLKDYVQTLHWFNKIDKTKSKEQYARSLINLGIIFFEQKKFDEALRQWDQVLEEYSIKEYQRVIYWKAQYYFQHKKDNSKAVELLNNIKFKEYPRYYALSNKMLSEIYKSNKRKSTSFLKKIKRIHDSDIYAQAQIDLFLMYENIDFLKNIELKDSEEKYSAANYALGILSSNWEEKKNYWSNIVESSNFFQKNRYEIKLLKKISRLENKKHKDLNLELLTKVENILYALFVSSTYEDLIAHYTNLTVSKLLLSQSKNKKEDEQGFKVESPLRLNTINLMNDPKEGLLLNTLVGLDEKIYTQDSAFISCFTLHHDSLNQFRLYAKEEQQEAAGLSLILNKNFFATEHNLGSIYEQNKQKVKISKKEIEDNKCQKALTVMPLYRCIYFDPTLVL